MLRSRTAQHFPAPQRALPHLFPIVAVSANMTATETLHKELKEQVASFSRAYQVTVPIDEAVRGVLPKGTIARTAERSGRSAWSFTAKINAIDKDGKPTPLFLKYVPGDLGRRQLEGEFVGMTELHKLAPNLVPKPIAWGKLKSVIPTTYFLLLEFKDFKTNAGLLPERPDPVKLGARVAAMHRNCVSPNGMFGFHIQTYDGARLQAVEWDLSWTSFFGKLLAEAYRQDTEENGVWEELELVHQRVQSHLIPRLIGALEADGRSVAPMLIHGNMWDGNIGIEKGTQDPWIYDCAAYYAHNEMELGIWRAQRHELRDWAYRENYLAHFEPSDPEEEWHDRIRLYSAKTNFMHSACYPIGTLESQSRSFAFSDMAYLIQKYVPWEGSEEWSRISKILPLLPTSTD